MRNLRTRIFAFSAIVLLTCLGMDGSVGTSDRAASVYDYATQALLWYQSSAECRALYYQAYNTARLVLDNNLRIHSTMKKKAVIFDIDETILDDSPHSALLLKQNKLFPYRYDEWIEAAKEPALPGALEFARYAASRGVGLFYISNRTTKMMAATVRNLRSAGFPQVEESHVLLMGDDPSKESRRKTVAASYEVVLLLGDNLNDLSNAFEIKDVAGRSAAADKAKSLFGSKYIVLPNPVYGAWESAVFGGKSNLSEEEKDAMRKAALKAFE